jgi:ABC-2 type transport system permease protein
MGAIYRREMGAFFSSAIAYIFLGVFYMIAGFFFVNSTIMYATTDLSGAFGSVFLILIFLIPLMTMKLFSEEKRQKTEQGLLTAPIGITSIVLGKYFAALTLYTMGISIFLVFALIIEFFGGVAWATVLSNFVAIFFLGAAFIAVTLFVSALTENQIISAIVGFLSLLVLYLMDSIAKSIGVGWVTKVVEWISFIGRYSAFAQGVIDYSNAVFFVGFTAIFIFLTVRVLDKRRYS